MRLRPILRIARLLHRRYEFFKVLRVLELIGYYARYLRIFQESGFSLAVMSSHSNPHGIAFNLAARKYGVPVVLITHGMPVRPVAKLSYDLAVVHCEVARQTYLEAGCRMDRVSDPWPAAKLFPDACWSASRARGRRDIPLQGRERGTAARSG